MVPDTVLRLAAVAKALEDIILPALPKDASFAHEQLALIVKSIALVGKQIPHEYAMHVHDARAFVEFGRDIVAQLPADHAARKAIEMSIADVEAVAPAEIPRREKLERSVRALRAAIEQAVETAGADPAIFAAIGPAVLEHTERQTKLERLWVVDTGFDPDPESLPSLGGVLYDDARD